jgi:hypothetical protein
MAWRLSNLKLWELESVDVSLRKWPCMWYTMLNNHMSDCELDKSKHSFRSVKPRDSQRTRHARSDLCAPSERAVTGQHAPMDLTNEMFGQHPISPSSRLASECMHLLEHDTWVPIPVCIKRQGLEASNST